MSTEKTSLVLGLFDGMGDAVTAMSAGIAVAAVIISYWVYRQQRLFQEDLWRRSNSFSLLQQWNGDMLRPARSVIYQLLEKNRTYQFDEFKNDPEVFLKLQLILHFFDEAAKLSRSGYIDRKLFFLVTVEAFTDWKLRFERFAPGDGDDTVRLKSVQEALAYLIQSP